MDSYFLRKLGKDIFWWEDLECRIVSPYFKSEVEAKSWLNTKLENKNEIRVF